MLDLLEKGMRQPDARDYMTAYEIEGHPGLHLSHHYFRDLTPEQVGTLVGKMKSHFEANPLQGKPLSFAQEEHFGPDKDIRVLVNDSLAPHLDAPLKAEFERSHPSRFPQYRPHVTTQDHPAVSGKIKRFYFQRGDGQTLFSVNAQPQPATMEEPQKTNLTKGSAMPGVNVKVEGIEVKRPQTGVAMQQTAPKGAAMPPMKPAISPPPKPSAMTSKMNKPSTAPLQKAAPVSSAPSAPATIDYSKFQRPVDSRTGSVPPLHNPIQHSKGATQGQDKHLFKADPKDPKFERCVQDVKAEGKSIEEVNPWAVCHASLGKNEDLATKDVQGTMVEKLRKLRKCAALKKAMPVYMRD